MVNECSWLSRLFRRFFLEDIYGSFYLRFFGHSGSEEHCLALELDWRGAVAMALGDSAWAQQVSSLAPPVSSVSQG